MAATLADDNFKYILLNEKDRVRIQISLRFVPREQMSVNLNPNYYITAFWELEYDTPGQNMCHKLLLSIIHSNKAG